MLPGPERSGEQAEICEAARGFTVARPGGGYSPAAVPAGESGRMTGHIDSARTGVLTQSYLIFRTA